MQLVHDPLARRAFSELLVVVRQRSTLLRHPVLVGSRHTQVDALLNFASHAPGFVRPAATWDGCRGSRHAVVASLAQHLLARHSVPRFLCSVWFGGQDADAQVKRGWFIAHGAGSRFRALDLPMSMTRKMESIFSSSPDHLSVEWAMRRAELLGLGASEQLMNAVLLTRLGSNLDHGDFYRTLSRFLVRFQDELDPAMVGPIVDFIHHARHERVRLDGPDGVVFLEPPYAELSLKGRTLASLLRMVADWHRSLGRGRGGGLQWARSATRPLFYEERPLDANKRPIRWELVELASSAELQREGRALQHCVASYDRMCHRGISQIWSLRRKSLGDGPRSVVTVEVDPRCSAVVQARGFGNRSAKGVELQLIQWWARRENLRMAIR